MPFTCETRTMPSKSVLNITAVYWNLLWITFCCAWNLPAHFFWGVALLPPQMSKAPHKSKCFPNSYFYFFFQTNPFPVLFPFQSSPNIFLFHPAPPLQSICSISIPDVLWPYHSVVLLLASRRRLLSALQVPLLYPRVPLPLPRQRLKRLLRRRPLRSRPHPSSPLSLRNLLKVCFICLIFF